MKKQMILTILVLGCVAMICRPSVCEASFFDDFGNPGLIDYTYEDSYGGGGSYNISGGKLNITTGSHNTASVMTSEAVGFAVRQTLSLEVPGVSSGESVFMMCSTVAGQADRSSSFGFRFRRGGGIVRVDLYPGEAQEDFSDPSPGASAKFIVIRTSDDSFDFAIEIEGEETALASFTLPELAGINKLHIGAQAFNTAAKTFSFDNLQVEELFVDCMDVTVLTYNTHLFEDTSPEFLAPETYHDDTTRRHRIASKIMDCGADIVGLQEVWAYSNQQYFINALKQVYPYAAAVDSTCGSWMGLDALGNGLVLLSKWPLSDVGFERFPTFEYSELPGNYDSWANKGILTATVIAGNPTDPRPFRVGITHAPLDDDDYKGKMSRNHVDITPFELSGQPYIFGLHVDVGANIWRIDDYGTSYSDEKGLSYGAGKQLVHYGGQMSGSYKFVRSFQLNGHPYIFALHDDVGANIWRINDDPATGFTLVKYGAPMSPNYVAVVTFELNGHPYIFGLHKDRGAMIWRINDDPSTGFELVKYGASMSSNYVAVVSFEIDGHPYIFGLHDGSGPMIWRINDDPSTGMTQMCYNCNGGPTSSKYGAMTSFQLNGHAYIFGLHENDYASIWRIDDGLPMKMTLISSESFWDSNYRFVKSFQMNGHPYLFGLKNCCNQYPDICFRDRPGEAYITRINDDPNTGWEDVLQMGNMKIIAEETVVKGGPPAVFMGDLNVHLSRYGVMDAIFQQAGAVDAYMKVHGIAEGGETVDLLRNKLHQVFSTKDPNDPAKYPKESSFDRIDYVYVKETGDGFKLIPDEAYVIRDWTYDDIDDNVPDMDLSDHYPVVVKFKLRHQRDLDNDCSVNFNDFSTLGSAWMAQPSDWNWDPFCDISDPPDSIIDAGDLEALAEYWLVTP